jgi:hypothetical protein
MNVLKSFIPIKILQTRENKKTRKEEYEIQWALFGNQKD